MYNAAIQFMKHWNVNVFLTSLHTGADIKCYFTTAVVEKQAKMVNASFYYLLLGKLG